jgi:Raf kinase inhibitor-like YbhB/YbcL family protein
MRIRDIGDALEDIMPLTIESPAFGAGDRIPKRHTCEGENVSPALTWTGVPAGTESLLLVCFDPDAPGGTFHHWAVYNIPPEWRALDEGFSAKRSAGSCQEAVNDFGKAGYRGPCPPKGDKPHAYHFRVSALRQVMVKTSPAITCKEVMRAAKPHEIAAAEIVGSYGR